MNTTESQNDLIKTKQALELIRAGDTTSAAIEKVFGAPADKWAAEKAAHAQGKKVQHRFMEDGEWSPWLDCQQPIRSMTEGNEYRIAPDPAPTYHTPNVVQQRREEAAAINTAMNPAPAGKLSDEWLANMAAIASGACDLICKPRATAFAAAVREAVEKEQAEEVARLTAIIEQAIEMVNTPGTTKDNLPQAINAKIMQRDEFHDATLKKLDAAKEDVKRLLKLDATNRENCDRAHKALVESQLLQLETQKALAAVTSDCDRMQLEFKKQAEKMAFEEWWDSCDQFDNSKPAAWFVWQARAAKEGEK